MRFTTLVTVICLLCLSQLQAQRVLEGDIMIDDYDGEAFLIEVQNLTQQTHQITSNQTFHIAVNAGDILLFESGMTEPRKFVVTEKIYQLGQLNIHLNPYKVHLKDIVVNDVLTGDLAKDMASANIVDHDSINEALAVKITTWDKMNMQKRPLIQPVNGEMNSSINLTAIGGLLKALSKPKKKYPEVQPKSLEEIRIYLGNEFFEAIEIAVAEIPYFMAFVADKNQALLTFDYLEIIRIFSEEVDAYHHRDGGLQEQG